MLQVGSVAYSVFIDTVCEGGVPAIRDADDKPVVFATRAEAQREIADNLITRLQEFIDGERDFDDAMSVADYIVQVRLLPDRSVIDPDGNHFDARRPAHAAPPVP